VVAVYVDKVGILRAAAVADVAAAASLGAALTRIPPSTVKECVATRATARMDLVIATPNYPDGRLSLVLAGWPAGGRSAPPLPQEDAATTHSVANCSSFRPSA
jgi:hypothetical protein